MKDPLFVADRDTLKRKLRLSGSSDCKDIADLLDEAICSARFRFYGDLGIDCVTQLLGITPVPNPTDQDALLRDLAALTEVRLVRLELLCLVPVFFADASGKVLDAWNEEALTRETDAMDLNDLKRCWEDKIKEAMGILRDKTLPDPIDPDQVTCRVWSTKGANALSC